MVFENASTPRDDNARADVSCHGLYGDCSEMSMLDACKKTCTSCRACNCTNRSMENQQVLTPPTNIPLRECCIPLGQHGTSSTNFDWLLRNYDMRTCNTAKVIAAKLTEFINEFVEESERCPSILKLISVFCQIILQKTSHRRTSDYRKVLERRLKWWDEGTFEELLKEARCFQSKDLTTRGRLADNDVISTVRGIVHAGNIARAAKLIEIEALLMPKQLHPESSPVNPEFVNTLLVNVGKFNSYVFMEISSYDIKRSAEQTNGGAGPSGMTAQAWFGLLSGRSRESTLLAESLARFATMLASKSLEPS
ncbi:hypothetical protein GJ496_000771 [Pomphorhynchus laevis]|nr:hypothetical protein GJ496_000771 [Pomphorhynchus laevis]